MALAGTFARLPVEMMSTISTSYPSLEKEVGNMRADEPRAAGDECARTHDSSRFDSDASFESRSSAKRYRAASTTPSPLPFAAAARSRTLGS